MSLTSSRGPSHGLITNRTIAAATLLLAGVTFLVGGAIVIIVDVPPSGSPGWGMLGHALWATASGLLAIGVVALLIEFRSLRRSLSGYLAAGALCLGALHGLNWAAWAYVDVRGGGEAEHEVVLEVLVVPYGAGHLLVAALILGAAVAWLAWALSLTELAHHGISLIGAPLGLITVVLAAGSLVFAVDGGEDSHLMFDAVTVMLPVIYFWVIVLSLDSYRRGRLSGESVI